MSDLTAVIEAAKEIIKQGDATRGKPSGLQGGYVNTAIRDGYRVSESLLDLTSQPLYRRRKAEWSVNDEIHAVHWRDYFVCQEGSQWWAQNESSMEQQPFETRQLAQAACEDHFWQELERDVLERVN